LLSSNKVQPFKRPKKFKKSITVIEKKLVSGCLVTTNIFPEISCMMYINRCKSKKLWHRKYLFLANGKKIILKRQQLYLIKFI
jgi:hypothetical protein